MSETISRPGSVVMQYMIAQLIFPAAFGALLVGMVLHGLQGYAAAEDFGALILCAGLTLYFAQIWVGTELGLRYYTPMRFAIDLIEAVLLSVLVFYLTQQSAKLDYQLSSRETVGVLVSLGCVAFLHILWNASAGTEVTTGRTIEEIEKEEALKTDASGHLPEQPQGRDRVLRLVGNAITVRIATCVLGIFAVSLGLSSQVVLALAGFVYAICTFVYFARTIRMKRKGPPLLHVLASRILGGRWQRTKERSGSVDGIPTTPQ